VKTDFTERIDRTKNDLTNYLTSEGPKLQFTHVSGGLCEPSKAPIGYAIQKAKTNGMPDEKKQGLVEQLTALKISMAVEWESNPRWGKATKQLNKWITDACLLQNKEALKAAAAQHNEDNDEEDLDEKERPGRSGQWRADEQQRFLAALHRGLGNAAISACVGSRDETQVRSHTQQYLKSLQKKQQGTPEAVGALTAGKYR
jgi:hypothetical protein